MADQGPSFAEVSRRISALLYERGEEWSGLPMPIPGLRLTLESKHPWKARIAELEAVLQAARPDEPLDEALDRDAVPIAARQFDDGPWTLRNTWYSTRLGAQITILQNPRGRVTWSHGKFDYVRRFQMQFDTLRAAKEAWALDTELTAVERLGELLAPRTHLWEAYITVGQFIETSARSGVTYVFRRARPTIAFRDERILCTLCMHPLGYYEGTYAGSMCPTDDVIAHYALMKGDEKLFWRRANQHAPWRPESAL
jgi:hypothetical protein